MNLLIVPGRNVVAAAEVDMTGAVEAEVMAVVAAEVMTDAGITTADIRSTFS